MFKSLLIGLIVIISVSAIHMQKFAPSTPGGNYNTNTNGTINGNSGSTTTAYVNGKPYQYTGPFTLVCFWANSYTERKWDTCRNQNDCAYIINDYAKCAPGTVQKFSLPNKYAQR